MDRASRPSIFALALAEEMVGVGHGPALPGEPHCSVLSTGFLTLPMWASGVTKLNQIQTWGEVNNVSDGGAKF